MKKYTIKLRLFKGIKNINIKADNNNDAIKQFNQLNYHKDFSPSLWERHGVGQLRKIA